MPTQAELRLKNLMQERDEYRSRHEVRLADIASREDTTATDDDKKLLRELRELAAARDEEVTELVAEIERDNKAVEQSKAIRRALTGALPGVELEDDGTVYRDKNAYIWDFFIASQNVAEVRRITRQWGVTDDEIENANQRLQLVRAPANTLSSNVAGLTPPQHIAQIFQIVNRDRPLVNAAQRVDLERGTLTYPQVDTSPVVAVQATQKTEAGNTGMAISMVTKTASTYLGGGDLSWQAINWSTPSALRLWFDLVAADYAQKTEDDAGTVVSASAFLNNIATTLAATPTFAQFMTAVGAGYGEVYANSGRTADSIIMAPDRFGFMLGLTSDAFTQFVDVGQSGIGPLRVIVSPGLNAGEIIVGDIDALLVAETPGAPVEMQVVEPAIGGVEVGLIGAFEAAVVDDGAFALITTAS
jgi:HK97 family phage major capsid protein